MITVKAQPNNRVLVSINKRDHFTLTVSGAKKIAYWLQNMGSVDSDDATYWFQNRSLYTLQTAKDNKIKLYRNTTVLVELTTSEAYVLSCAIKRTIKKLGNS